MFCHIRILYLLMNRDYVSLDASPNEFQHSSKFNYNQLQGEHVVRVEAFLVKNGSSPLYTTLKLTFISINSFALALLLSYIKVVLRALPWPTRMPWIRSRISIRAFACKKNLWIELAAGFIYRWWFWRSPAYRVPPPYTNIWGDEQKIVHDYLSLTYLFSAVPSCKLSSELI